MMAGLDKKAGMERRALGKGLDSLLPRVAATAAPGSESESGKPMEIALEEIDRNPFQTRKMCIRDRFHVEHSR